MTDSIDVPGSRFRVELDDGQIVETDGSTILDPESGDQVPAVVLRMSRARAHVLAHVLEDWSRVALVFATLRSSCVTERALALTLDSGAALAGDAGATRCAVRVSERVTTAQRLAAVDVLKTRERDLSPLQCIAVVDAAARWMSEEAGEELAWALLAAVCSDTATTNLAYTELLDSGSER
ncbi:hypothetical protein [Cryptosporangium aurantiacum]|uniref:Uncharacterized protein n=1 Tax=Cryptosporangium aurantiacum TaxID=134849 RepID=A0A1M7QQQ8_9ACTN|nr:hypothetical protein [Cryptosporangium aurantiacum]SHN33937.1 hypothetical protein SAMN05443668_105201 [Cryptosporangium aurantiacum]